MQAASRIHANIFCSTRLDKYKIVANIFHFREKRQGNISHFREKQR